MTAPRLAAQHARSKRKMKTDLMHVFLRVNFSNEYTKKGKVQMTRQQRRLIQRTTTGRLLSRLEVILKERRGLKLIFYVDFSSKSKVQ